MRARQGRALLALAALLLGGCASLSGAQRNQGMAIAHSARSTLVDCTASDACAVDTPVLELASRAFAESTPSAPRHYALIIDQGPDALMARIAMIRGARRSIDLQTYIFDEDDSAQLVLDELQAAAYRGVKVRLLLDQLSALENVSSLAALSAMHVNFELRLYNPVLDRARLSLPMYAVAIACCWRKLNRRMHNKLLLVDGQTGITGGRNYQDTYYDWDASYNFRDRDLLVAGPVAGAMAANFEAFWNAPKSIPAERLADVSRLLRTQGPPPPPHHPYRNPQRVQELLEDVADPGRVRERLVAPALAVGAVQFIADPPAKHRGSTPEASAPATDMLQELIASAQDEVLLQTPYLVLSKPAQALFRRLHEQDEPPRVRVSTNSLASTDAFFAYAISYKYRRRYLRDFGFEIHEFKPFPASAPFALSAAGVELAEAARTDTANHVAAPTIARRSTLRERRLAERGLQSDPRSESIGVSGRFRIPGSGLPVRLKRAGIRMGLHSKSLVVDERVGVIGTHNFDPRGDNYNTESAVFIADPVFARQLATSIRGDMAPENAWTIARRDPSPILPGIEYSLGKISEHLPIFDLWPTKYATSYEFVPGPACPTPPSPFHDDFRRCHTPVGDFPEVDLGLKWLGVRLFTAFGSGLAPIL